MPFLLPDDKAQNEDGSKTCYCLYTGTFSLQFESDTMSGHSPAVAAAVTNISVKLHETQDFHQAMAAAVGELLRFCDAERCRLFTVDSGTQYCRLISNNGVEADELVQLSKDMERSPYEIAMAWEKDLDGSSSGCSPTARQM